MKMINLVVVFLLLLSTACSKSTSSFSTFGSKDGFEIQSTPNSQTPGEEKRGFWGTPKPSGAKYDAKYYKKHQKELKKRQKALAKKYKKQAKMAEDPQYSDPMYFGHKKPPKKRKPGKRKFCKVCEIVH
ncbi:hypothetical protein AB9P05_06475 [Roseivirga sp. BDSF3-8]|uniref:hypothetical protein n=1 Tax=Roseivirga sp. BDSF3-8 TaxID=3241598 RepID=UPI003531B490